MQIGKQPNKSVKSVRKLGVGVYDGKDLWKKYVLAIGTEQ